MFRKCSCELPFFKIFFLILISYFKNMQVFFVLLNSNKKIIRFMSSVKRSPPRCISCVFYGIKCPPNNRTIETALREQLQYHSLEHCLYKLFRYLFKFFFQSHNHPHHQKNMSSVKYLVIFFFFFYVFAFFQTIPVGNSFYLFYKPNQFLQLIGTYNESSFGIFTKKI